MARLSATKKYRDTNVSIYDYYIELCNINETVFEFECDTKMVDEFGNHITDVLKGNTFKIICRDVVLINGRCYVSICYDVDIGYVLISSIRKPSINGRQYNKGEIAEGLLTIAMIAKLLKYNLTIETIKQLILEYNQVDDCTLQYNEFHLSSEVKLNKIAICNLVNIGNHVILTGIYNAIIQFAQTSYISQFYNDNNVEIKTIGYNGNKNIKADIELSSNSRKLYISLKCGNTKNLEQAGTSEIFAHKVVNSFGIYLEDIMTEYEKTVTWYAQLFNEIVTKFNSLNPYERHYGLANGIINAATRNCKNTIQVHINDNNFGVYLYKNLFIKLNQLNIIAEYDNIKSKNPRIFFKNASDNMPLISFYIETRDGGRRLTLHIMKEKLLSELTIDNTIQTCL